MPPKIHHPCLSHGNAGWILLHGFVLASVADADRPNVVLIIADDLGYGELSCQGGDIATPHIDSIALDGVRFTDGYVTAPYCAASRAAIMTGRYQTRFGFEFNPIGARNMQPHIGLPVSERTFANDLQDIGYSTGLIGKWHLGGTAAYHPLRRGFDDFFGFTHEGHYFVPPPYEGTITWLRRKSLPDGGQGRWISPDGRTIWTTHMGHHEPDYDADNPLVRNSQPVNETDNLTDAFDREARSFINRHQSQPFLLCLAYNAVHSPLQAEDDYFTKFAHIEDIQRRIFAAMLSHLDDSVGRVLQTLDERNLSDNTLVIFISDNGGPTAELTSSNAPLRGGKGNLWEGGTRVPWLMKWPGKISPGTVVKAPVISTDIAATVRDLARAGQPKVRDGLNLLPYLGSSQQALPERPMYWRVGERSALRRGDWKVSRNAGREASLAWTLTNLRSDLAEQEDLAAQEPELLDELIEQWERLDREMEKPAW